jgi:hypothetical protein
VLCIVFFFYILFWYLFCTQFFIYIFRLGFINFYLWFHTFLYVICISLFTIIVVRFACIFSSINMPYYFFRLIELKLMIFYVFVWVYFLAVLYFYYLFWICFFVVHAIFWLLLCISFYFGSFNFKLLPYVFVCS